MFSIRFEKCLKTGMKLEAIREDRTRGGRSTYQCSYTLPQVFPTHFHTTLEILNEIIKCRLDNFSNSFLLLYLNLSNCKNK